jgi:hypothetical protein
MPRFAVTAALASVLLAAALTRAADDRDRARTFFILKVVDALDLPDDKALQLRGILRRVDERRVELVQKRESLQAKLRAALEAKPRDPTLLAQLVAEGNAVDGELATLPERSFTDAQKLLTVEQQAKLMLLRRELQGEVHQAMRRRLATPRPRRESSTTTTHPTPSR